MLVVADSSPLYYLILIGHLGILENLFGNVVIPPQVQAELTHPHTPEAIRDILRNPPAWISVQVPDSIEAIPEIDPGECAAISLARLLHADLLLIDDLDGRDAARQRGVAIIGTIGVLEAAATRDLLNLEEVFRLIRQTPFRVSDQLLTQALDRDRQRRSSP